MKNSSDSFGNRTRDLPACSTVPQPTVPPRVPAMIGCTWKSDENKRNISSIGAGTHGEEATWEHDKENDERLDMYVKEI